MYVGEFRKLINTTPAEGSIHDDEAAQSLGFRGAFVPGSVVGTKALIACAAVFGERFFESGRYGLTFVSPVYENEAVREVAEMIGEGRLSVRVETADGRVCCAGEAALENDLVRGPDEIDDEVLPGVNVGLEFAPMEFRIEPGDVAPLLSAAGDDGPWYRNDSSWGRGVAPLERLQRVALDLSRTKPLVLSGVRMPGMWAAHSLSVQAPLFLEETYLMRERIVEKARSGRTTFVTYEFSVHQPTGEEIAVGRHRVKWLTE